MLVLPALSHSPLSLVAKGPFISASISFLSFSEATCCHMIAFPRQRFAVTVDGPQRPEVLYIAIFLHVNI